MHVAVEVFPDSAAIEVDSFEDHRELGTAQLDARLAAASERTEGSLLEPLVEQPEAVPIPHESLMRSRRASKKTKTEPSYGSARKECFTCA